MFAKLAFLVFVLIAGFLFLGLVYFSLAAGDGVGILIILIFIIFILAAAYVFFAIQSRAQKKQKRGKSNWRPILENKQFEQIDAMDGHEFEAFCAALLLANGFSKAEVTRGSGDNGVDIIAEKGGITYAIQCKRYTSNIGNKAVQEVYSGKSIYQTHVAAVLTNQFFTPQAIEAAEIHKVLLWDRADLEKMIAGIW